MADNSRTETSAFGVGARVGHDSTAFYARFGGLQGTSELAISDVAAPGDVDVVRHGDARDLSFVPTNSVALAVTSPPYFAGKEYEQLDNTNVPQDFDEFLRLLSDTFVEVTRTLEPGGRVAVNVANIGRKPYRSLSAELTTILADTCGLHLQGEIIWRKAATPGSSCAWGSFCSPHQPSLRDVSERILIASKAGFSRAGKRSDRKEAGLPCEPTTNPDEFAAATCDVWELAPASATQLGHPAPFPVSLPERLIRLYTYRGDVVLDPFAGSGTVGVAARRTGRRFVCVDNDLDYVELARRRIAAAAEVEFPSQSLVAWVTDLLDGRLTTLERVAAPGAMAGKVRVGCDRAGVRWVVEVAGSNQVADVGLCSAQAVATLTGRVSVFARSGTKVLVATSKIPTRGQLRRHLVELIESGLVAAVVSPGGQLGSLPQ